MSDPAILVENLGKRYRIGRNTESLKGHRAFFHRLSSPFLYLVSTLREPAPDEIIWSLKNVSFEVKHGEIIGIIGRNGAGKSTLLKILSRITEPTEGRAYVNGRVGSLLEVGTGFHPELTGRENIYLNGTILGMKKWEIDRKFDEIVDFSGVEKFLYTPVKRYSSGMYVRLAFAVAAHLEPEILLIDEVLAVGDLAFQKKCIGKMGDVAKHGRTVLFVSHNMAAIRSLCPSSIYLKEGSIDLRGPTEQVIQGYMDDMASLSNRSIEQRTDRQGNGTVQVSEFWIENKKGQRLENIPCGEQVSFNISYRADGGYPSLRFIVSVYNDLDQRILRFDSDITPTDLDRWPKAGLVKCSLKTPLPLKPGQYRANVAVFAYDQLADYLVSALGFEVIAGDFFGTGKLPSDGWPLFLVNNQWSVD